MNKLFEVNASNEELKEIGLKLGAEDYITKPFEPLVLF